MGQTLQPFRDNILVRRERSAQYSSALQPANSNQDLLNEGEVIAVGEGRLNPRSPADLIPLVVKVGDMVVFTSRAGHEIKIEERDLPTTKDIFSFSDRSEYILIREHDILGFRK